MSNLADSSEIDGRAMEDDRPRRQSLKARHPNWTEKLRENCFKRVRADRNRLLWKMRLPSHPSFQDKMAIESTFRDIVSNELKSIKDTSISPSSNQLDVDLWEYNGIHMPSQSAEAECEEILLEMQRTFYEDLRAEQTKTGHGDDGEIWEEEDDYLAQVAFEHLHLNDQKVWCPICKRGDLRQGNHLIYCTVCKLQIERGDEVSLELLQARLADVHMEHLDRGCKLAPKFCTESRFTLTALYIKCEACNTFEIVV